MCVWRKEGGAFPFNASALLSVSQSLRIYSVYFLFLPFPVSILSVLCQFFSVFLYFSLSCQTHTLNSLISATQDLTFTRLVSFLLYLLFVFPAQSLGFWLSLLHHSYCILRLPPGCAHCVRNQEQAEVGVLRVSSLRLRLHVFGISLSLCLPLAHPSLFLPLVTSLC